jgi:exodeoxyribonuclease (lambda-induced)
MKIYNMAQGSEEWNEVRRGKITASKMSCVISAGEARSTYMNKLISQIITGDIEPHFCSQAMKWGIEKEPLALDIYGAVNGVSVQLVGFVEKNNFIGVSPDGMLEDGLVEVKCPNTETFIEYFKKGTLPAKYKAQVNCQMWVCEKSWCDFVVYDPRIVKGYWEVRVDRDDEYIDKMETKVNLFIEEMNDIIDKL